MKKTTTQNIVKVITSKEAQVEHVVIRYSIDDVRTEPMEPEKLIESLEFLNEIGRAHV